MYCCDTSMPHAPSATLCGSILLLPQLLQLDHCREYGQECYMLAIAVCECRNHADQKAHASNAGPHAELKANNGT